MPGYIIGVDPAQPDSEMCRCVCPHCRRPFSWKPDSEKPPAKCPGCRKWLNWAGLRIAK